MRAAWKAIMSTPVPRLLRDGQAARRCSGISAPSRIMASIAAPPWVMSRYEPAARQVEPTSSAPRQSSTHHTTPVTNSTAVTVYSEARTRGSSRTMLDLRPIAGDVHAAVARDEERTRAVVIEETDHHLSRHDDD